ncbi:unnamed protein product [Rhizophagus irregularis]|uniref:Uncharacterized protein n=1 Tax=Rhizophagus irregularis TaxID=588596 RepID=A0A2N1NGY7_9GLOM|nr:hypothetical protein RhiirC2_709815 [Rhizophagus irregularis]CAB4396384.1 unnamed protein product [Rhizophagus irregularis]CAB5363396.1 unnamed protein product [Rhizophagus irregularis]
MNQKYFIISLLVFFFLYVEKSHGCHPSGGQITSCTEDCPQITNASFTGGKLNITVYTYPDYPPEAFGHFTFKDDQGHEWRFLKKPIFVNDHSCNHKGDYENNPYTSYWNFDSNQTPKETWFDIWLAVYVDPMKKVCVIFVEKTSN